jgi:hypothetical protein
MEDFYTTLTYFCEFCSFNKSAPPINEYSQILDKMPRVHISDASVQHSAGNNIGCIGFYKHYRCKKHCLICAGSSRHCCMHCVICWPFIIKLFAIDLANLNIRDEPIPLSVIRATKKNKYSADNIERYFTKKLKSAPNCVISSGHFHSDVDLAVYIYRHYNIAEADVVALF